MYYIPQPHQYASGYGDTKAVFYLILLMKEWERDLYLITATNTDMGEIIGIVHGSGVSKL